MIILILMKAMAFDARFTILETATTSPSCKYLFQALAKSAISGPGRVWKLRSHARKTRQACEELNDSGLGPVGILVRRAGGSDPEKSGVAAVLRGEQM